MKMKNSQRTKWMIRIGLLIIVFIVILGKPIYTILTSQESWSKNDPVDYRSLFKNELSTNLLLFNTIESKTVEPESQYIYNQSFNIFVTKIHINDTLNLNKSITIKDQHAIKEYNDLYFSIRSLGCKIHVKSGELPLTNNIEINIKNTDFKILDSTLNQMSLYTVFKRFSLTINQNQTYLIAETDEPNYPMAITFIKKNNLLYLLLMTPASKNIKMQPDQLKNLIN